MFPIQARQQSKSIVACRRFSDIPDRLEGRDADSMTFRPVFTSRLHASAGTPPRLRFLSRDGRDGWDPPRIAASHLGMALGESWNAHINNR